MDMSTFPVPDGVWGGQLEFEWSPELQRQTVEAYYKFQMERIAQDPGVESLSGWGVSDGEKYIQKVVSADRHVPNGGHPEAFDDFYALKSTALAGNCKPSELAAHDDLSSGGHHQTVYFSEATRFVHDLISLKFLTDDYAGPACFVWSSKQTSTTSRRQWTSSMTLTRRALTRKPL